MGILDDLMNGAEVPTDALLAEARESKNSRQVWGQHIRILPEVPYGCVLFHGARLHASLRTMKTMMETTEDELVRGTSILSGQVFNEIPMVQLWPEKGPWIQAIIRAVGRAAGEGDKRRARELATMLEDARRQTQRQVDDLDAALRVARTLLA